MTTSTIDSGPGRSAPSSTHMRIVWALCAAFGAYGLVQRITQGHMPAGYGSYMPWGLWVALYFHGVGIAGGALVVGAIGFVRGRPGFSSATALRAAIALSFAAIIPAFLAVWVDLGHMERAGNIMTSPSFGSMMAFNSWMYTAFLAVLAVVWLASKKGGSGWVKPLLCAAILLGVLFPSQSGAFFGVVDAKAFWHSALLPILFLTSAVTAGAAALLVVREIVARDDDDSEIAAAAGSLRKTIIVGLLAYFVLEFAEFSIALWNPYSHSPAVELVLWGPYWWVFWIVHVALGGVLPLALLATRNRAAWTTAGILVAVTFVSARLNVLVPGQAISEIRGLQEAYHHDRLKYIYHATPMEFMVGLLCVAVGMTVFFVARRLDGRRKEVTHA